MERKILLVDDDRQLRQMLSRCLQEDGFSVEEADSCAGACTSFQEVRPDLAVLDFRLPDGTALELLPRLKAIEPSTPIIVLTGFGSMELGVALIKAGAEQCLAKPIDPPALLLVIQKALENKRNQQQQIASKSKRKRTSADPFLGTSPAIRRLADTMARIADSHSPVLIQGETGAGKGVLATWIHENSPRREEPFVDLNCAGLSREFLETELFGHEKGAFTGAVTSKPGLLEVAHHGTAFLDEIGDVDPVVQPKLLKVIEEKRFRRLGDVRDRVVDVRLIAATHQDLARLMEEKRFRSDLYFRISTIPVVLPPLRERVEDVPLLARELLERIAADVGRPGVDLTKDALSTLCSYGWPGNIRELRNVLERALLMAGGKRVLDAGDFFFELAPKATAASFGSRMTLEDVERAHIERVLNEEKWDVDRAAKRLGLARSSLYRRMKTFKLNRSAGPASVSL